MSMDMFDNVLDNTDENYPFSLSRKLILALLVTVGICVIALGIVFIWYKRKTTLSSSPMGNLIKLVPSLVGNTPSLDSLLPILSELASSRTRTKTTPTTDASRQTTPDELILLLFFLKQLRITATCIDTKAPSHSLISIYLNCTTTCTSCQGTSLQESKVKAYF